MRKGLILSGIILLISSCQSDSPSNQVKGYSVFKSPLPNVEVPTQTLFFNADKGDTLEFAMGAKVSIPPASLVDVNGRPISGEVKLRFKQFVDAVDLFAAGIDMSYDSAGSTYTLESAGMCEVRAFQKGEEVFLKDGARLGIDLPSIDASAGYNLYRYDSLKGDWLWLDEEMLIKKFPKAEVLAIADDSLPIFEADPIADSLAYVLNNIETQSVGFIQPRKADPAGIQIEVDVLNESPIASLEIFENTQFELLENDSIYRDEHMAIVWSWAEVRETDQSGILDLEFSRPGQNIAYKVRPVYEGKDYDEALEVYAAEMERVEQLKIEEMQRLEAARQEQIRKLEEARQERVRKLEEYLKEQEQKLARLTQNQSAEAQKALQLQSEIMQNRSRLTGARWVGVNRSFSTNGFGTYNCDRIWKSPNVEVSPVVCFNDKSQVEKGRVDFVMGESNTMTSTYGNRKVRLPEGEEFAALSIKGEQFYYLPSTAVEELELNENNQIILILQEHDGPLPTDYSELRSLLDLQEKSQP